MRIFMLFILGLVVVISAKADPEMDSSVYQQVDSTQQENSSYNAPRSAMSNVQINPYSNARDYFGQGVSCSRPSVNVGLAGGERPHKVLGYVNVNIPLGGQDCKRAAKTRTQTMEYALYQMKTEQGKADKLFAAKMANMCLDIQSHMTIHQDNPLYSECAQYMQIEPNPDDIAAINSVMQRHVNGINGRILRLEGVAHSPNQTILMKDQPALDWQKSTP